MRSRDYPRHSGVQRAVSVSYSQINVVRGRVRCADSKARSPPRGFLVRIRMAAPYKNGGSMNKSVSNVLVVTVGLVLGSVALAAPVKRVTLCHFPPGNPDNAQVITVGEPAVEAHVANHNDAVCADDDSDCCFGSEDAASVCTNFETDVNNCGGCGVVCSLANATAACTDGECEVSTCDAGFGDCDSDAANGCETPLTTTSDCGSCGNACADGEVCTDGTCVSSSPG